MRIILGMLTYIFALSCAGVAAAQHASHSDKILNYKTCDGTNWTMSWTGNDFVHKNQATGATHQDNHAWYLTWDGTCWKLEWDAAMNRFRHTASPNGPSHADAIVNYLTWDNSKWTAVREEDGFYHLFIANPDPGKSKNIFDQVNRFLDKHGDDLKAAADLLRILAAQSE